MIDKVKLADRLNELYWKKLGKWDEIAECILAIFDEAMDDSYEAISENTQCPKCGYNVSVARFKKAKRSSVTNSSANGKRGRRCPHIQQNTTET